MFDYTIIGGSGFIGKSLVDYFREQGFSVYVPKKNDNDIFTKQLGILIYCAGVGDCANRPFEVFQSHSGLLSNVLQNAQFSKMIYISSTRLYMGQKESQENSKLTILTDDKRRLFNLTKLVAEELCLLSDKNVIIIRPSNVYGLALSSPLFLPAITRNAINNGKIDMYVTPDYAKDYLSIDDLVSAIYQVSLKNELSGQIYNIASGINVSAGQIAAVLQAETGCEVNWIEGSVDEYFPVTDIKLISKEINFNPRNVLDDLKVMIDDFKSVMVN